MSMSQRVQIWSSNRQRPALDRMLDSEGFGAVGADRKAIAEISRMKFLVN